MSKNADTKFHNGLTWAEGVEVLDDMYSRQAEEILSEDEIEERINAMRVYTAKQLVDEKIESVPDEQAHEVLDMLVIDYVASAAEIVSSYNGSGYHVYALNDDKIVVREDQ